MISTLKPSKRGASWEKVDFTMTRERTLSSNVAYRGRILNLRIDKVTLPDGKVSSREVIEHAPAVAVIPEKADGSVLLVEQYRYAVNRSLLEIPAGIVEDGEDPLEAAHRELMEEVGYDAASLVEVGRFFTSPGFSNEVIVLYHATDLCPARLESDDDEFIRVVEVAGKDLAEVFAEQDIMDAKSMAAAWWFLGNRCRD